MTTITINVSKMFAEHEPWDVSNSVANLAPDAARATWACATTIAARPDWLVTPLADALEYARAWARDTGAWERDEIALWSDEYCLALIVQNVASELRDCLEADDLPLIAPEGEDCCLGVYESTDWDSQPSYPIGIYYAGPKGLMCDLHNDMRSWDRD